jgi:hypothetical protein
MSLSRRVALFSQLLLDNEQALQWVRLGFSKTYCMCAVGQSLLPHASQNGSRALSPSRYPKDQNGSRALSPSRYPKDQNYFWNDDRRCMPWYSHSLMSIQWNFSKDNVKCDIRCHCSDSPWTILLIYTDAF